LVSNLNLDDDWQLQDLVSRLLGMMDSFKKVTKATKTIPVCCLHDIYDEPSPTGGCSL
jgi:hypothetical protein